MPHLQATNGGKSRNAAHSPERLPLDEPDAPDELPRGAARPAERLPGHGERLRTFTGCREIGAAGCSMSQSAIGGAVLPAARCRARQAERLRTVAHLHGLAGRSRSMSRTATGRTARHTGARRTSWTGDEPDGRREAHRRHYGADCREQAHESAARKSHEKRTWYIRGIVCHN